MTIDEAIIELKSENGYYANNGMTDVSEFNTEIIRWLEEMKKYKEKPEGYLWDEAVQQGYNKAIDDFVAHIENITDQDEPLYNIRWDYIAEQLKEGAVNGTDSK